MPSSAGAGITTTTYLLKNRLKPQIAAKLVVVVRKFWKKHHNCNLPISNPSIIEETCKLAEASFEYVCDVGEAKIFRKRK